MLFLRDIFFYILSIFFIPIDNVPTITLIILQYAYQTLYAPKYYFLYFSTACVHMMSPSGSIFLLFPVLGLELEYILLLKTRDDAYKNVNQVDKNNLNTAQYFVFALLIV